MRILLIFAVAALALIVGIMADEENVALRTVAQSTGGFANNFLKIVANDNPGNLICSPLSVQVVLAMAAYGAGGNTATQMRSKLLMPSDDVLGQSGYESLIKTMNTVKGVELRLVNKMYTADAFVVKSPYKQLTTTKFLSTSQELDFSNAQTAANTINSWCADQTNNKIKDIITPDSLTSDTKVILVNAVYFKGQWDKKFDPAQTAHRPFHTDARTTKNVPTMFVTHHYRFGDLPEIDARFIEIPYKDKELSMIIILPNQIDGLERVQNGLHQVNLSEKLRRTNPSVVELFLPKFKIESTLDLKPTLEKMGMTDMFGNSADFSGIAEAPLKVSKVIQKAFIEVNEEGSEAAAVTEIEVVPPSAHWPAEIRVDRPFLYSILQRSSETSLFNGKISNIAVI